MAKGPVTVRDGGLVAKERNPPETASITVPAAKMIFEYCITKDAFYDIK
jgi:hypothetical protein